MADHAFVSLRIFAERTLAYRRKDVDVSPKGRWHIAERTLAYRRKDVGVSPKGRWLIAEKASLFRRRSDDCVIS